MSTKFSLDEVLRLHSLWLSGKDGGEPAEIDGECLEGVNLEGVNLSGKLVKKGEPYYTGYAERDEHIVGAVFRNVNLNEANLKNANLSGARFYGGSMENADLEGCSLEDARLGQQSLKGAKLKGVNMEGVSIEKSDLRSVILEDVNLCHSSLCRVNLSRSRVENVTLHSSRLTGVNFYNATLKNVDLDRTWLEDTYLHVALQAYNVNTKKALRLPLGKPIPIEELEMEQEREMYIKDNPSGTKAIVTFVDIFGDEGDSVVIEKGDFISSKKKNDVFRLSPEYIKVQARDDAKKISGSYRLRVSRLDDEYRREQIKTLRDFKGFIKELREKESIDA